jgi:hypothetical protein
MMKRCCWACFVLLALLAGAGMQAQQTRPPGQVREPMKRVRLELRLNGLHPQNLTVEEGLYEIRVDSAILQSAVNLRIDDGQAREIARTNRPAGQFRAKQRMAGNLTPGEYFVSVVGQPQWRMRLTVVAKGK